MSLEIVKKTPNIFWFQSKENVILDIHIQNLNKNTVTIKNNIFNLDFDSYFMQFPFYESIHIDDLEFKENENYLRIIMKKMDTENNWKYLSQNNIYKNNIKVNWDNWYDEDEDEDEDFNLEQMMSGMMPPMDGMMPPMDGMMPTMDGLEDGEDFSENEDFNDDELDENDEFLDCTENDENNNFEDIEHTDNTIPEPELESFEENNE